LVRRSGRMVGRVWSSSECVGKTACSVKWLRM